MLSCDRLDVSYGHVQALRDVSFDVREGEMVALFGSNGAGKTTTLRAITGLVPPSDGRVTFSNEPIPSPERAAALGVAHLPEGRGIFGRMSVQQNLAMGGYASRLGSKELSHRIDEVLAHFPSLRGRGGQQAATLSGGEQQMVAIARALIGEPKLLMIDEPSHGLAPKIVREVFGLLGRLRDAGMSILVVEQYATAALGVADRAIVLERGRITFDGAPEDAGRDRLAGAYLGGVR